MLSKFAFFYFVFLMSFAATSSPQTIRFLPAEELFDDSHQYYVELLKLTLSKTLESDGPYVLRAIDYDMVQSRAIKELEKGDRIDIFWTMTSAERESKLLPIRIPLLKGMLGYRVFLIRAEDQQKFSMVETLNDLNKFNAGQGHDWPDTLILKNSGIKVIGVSDFDGLFTMLNKKRIDYIPRGINEPWSELKAHADKGFTVDSKILLYYKAPVYFFVNKKNPELAQRVERGLRIAIIDGSFEDLFRKHHSIDMLIKKLKLRDRVIFKLDNPYLTSKTPVNEKELWIEL